MEKIKYLIIGAGIIGLSIAKKLSEYDKSVVLVDQENSFGRHTSSRNSEVIHSGIYYPKSSLKARLCVDGNKLLYRYLEREKIPYKKCGKYIITNTESEKKSIENLITNGKNNGVSGLRLVTGNDITKKMPYIKATYGIWVPSTGILDVHALMGNLKQKINDNEAVVAFNTKVTNINKKETGYEISFKDGYKILSDVVINSAGLFSDQIAKLVGIDIDSNFYKLSYCKGEYYRTNVIKSVPNLVYPLPHSNLNSLGIHTRLFLDGTLAFGPNAYYIDKLDYSIDEKYKKDFFESISKYIDINKDDIYPSDTGIRPRLKNGDKHDYDFIIKNEYEKGFPNFINLIGIESPGLTSCLSIADYVKDLIVDVA
jgi:L-2-hydroxyglutarate oxidase LhgO